MTRPSLPDLPPDLPPEYAEAYRRGFERAYREASDDPVDGRWAEERARAEGEAAVEAERTARIEGLESLLAAAPAQQDAKPSHRGAGSAAGRRARAAGARAARPGWLVPAILAALVATLLVGAYLAGLVFSSSVQEADVEAEEPQGVVLGDGPGDGAADGSADGGAADAGQSPRDRAYQGRVATVPVTGSTASCIAPASVDAAGNEVTYEPALARDGDLTTAWRCPGSGSGESLTLQLAQELQVAELGLVPGYAKTDPRSGVDRYAENNRLTRVRWTFPDGTAIEQELDASPGNREMQMIRIRPVLAHEVVLEVLSSEPGRRNTIAISEVTIGTPAG